MTQNATHYIDGKLAGASTFHDLTSNVLNGVASDPALARIRTTEILHDTKGLMIVLATHVETDQAVYDDTAAMAQAEWDANPELAAAFGPNVEDNIHGRASEAADYEVTRMHVIIRDDHRAKPGGEIDP